MKNIVTIAWREFSGYFSTPIGYVFIAIFLFLNGIFTFELGGFFDSNQADLLAFFTWHPWLYLFLVSAVAMRLWSEERASGTVELLLTLPVTLQEAVIGKFLAAWAFIGIALFLTFPMFFTVTYLGDPDIGMIIAGYTGSFLMAGAYLSIGACISAMTKNQVISFIISVVICFFFLLASFPMVIDWFSGWGPQWLIDAIEGISFSTHYNSMMRGVIEFTDILFFVSLIAAWLFVGAQVLEAKKAS